MLDIPPHATLVGRDDAQQESSITKLVEVCLDQLASPLPLAALLGEPRCNGLQPLQYLVRVRSRVCVSALHRMTS